MIETFKQELKEFVLIANTILNGKESLENVGFYTKKHHSEIDQLIEHTGIIRYSNENKNKVAFFNLVFNDKQPHIPFLIINIYTSSRKPETTIEYPTENEVLDEQFFFSGKSQNQSSVVSLIEEFKQIDLENNTGEMVLKNNLKKAQETTLMLEKQNDSMYNNAKIQRYKSITVK